MNTICSYRWLCGLVALATLGLGCDPNANSSEQPAPQSVEPKRVSLGKNVYLEVQGEQRRVLISAQVCLRKGALEQLLCRTRTKEHEAILAANIDARDVHKALLAAGAVPGEPVRFDPKFEPPRGTPVKVFLQYEKDGKRQRIAAQKWIRDVKTNQEMTSDWVFTGSRLIPNPDDPMSQPYYLANDGDVICVSNMPGALLDVPIRSSREAAELLFEAFTERIPPEDTQVIVILEPILEKKE
ncbi:MAG: YdjY domain-containing protein [Gemmataceae bacterium]